MINLNEEVLAKAKQAKSVEELVTLAKESGIEMTAEQVQDLFARLNQESGELEDDELNNVAGGGCYDEDGYPRILGPEVHKCILFVCRRCGCTDNTIKTVAGICDNKCRKCSTDIICLSCRHCVSKNGSSFCYAGKRG